MTRAPKGNGTIKKKGTKFLAKFPIGRRINEKTGEYVTAYESKTFTTKTEAQRWLNKKIAAKENGQIAVGGKLTFRQFSELILLHGVLNISPRTADGYYRNLRKHVFPLFGKKFLTEIEPGELDMHFVELRKVYAASTVNAIRTAMSSVYKCALKQRRVTYNPVAHTLKARKGPLDVTQVQVPWSLEEIEAVLEASVDTPLEMFFTLAIGTGMRLGEMLGLRWEHVDFELGTISIEETVHREYETSPDGSSKSKIVVAPPKTESSRRVNHLFPAVVNALKRHQMIQNAGSILQGDKWTGGDYVFSNIYGGPMDERNHYRRYVKFLKKNNIRYIRIHDIRHTFATILITHDVGLIGAVSRALGHSSLAITMDVYGKTAKVEEQAFGQMSELVFPNESQGSYKKVPVPLQIQPTKNWKRKAS